MEKNPPPAAAPPSQPGIHRLILATSAAGALATLCWAALQVRAARAEVRQLQVQPAAQSSRTQSAPASLQNADTTDRDRRLAAAEAQQKQTADSSAARIRELENVIEFLRAENSAAQQTIERLSHVRQEPSRPAKAEPVRTKSGRSPDRNAPP